jgi:hypothetical protein
MSRVFGPYANAPAISFIFDPQPHSAGRTPDTTLMTFTSTIDEDRATVVVHVFTSGSSVLLPRWGADNLSDNAHTAFAELLNNFVVQEFVAYDHSGLPEASGLVPPGLPRMAGPCSGLCVTPAGFRSPRVTPGRSRCGSRRHPPSPPRSSDTSAAGSPGANGSAVRPRLRYRDGGTRSHYRSCGCRCVT